MIVEELAKHIVEADFDAIDSLTIKHAKKRIIDVIGCMIGGSKAPGCEILVDLVKEWGGREEATIAVYGIKAPAHNVAMVNCIMSRSYDFGPVIAWVEGKPVVSHISESTIPTTLTMAEWKHIGGKEFLTALIYADDIVARILATEKRIAPGGWEHTGIANVFGTTAIAGRILGLSVQQLINAFGIALNQMGGTMQNLFDGAQTFKFPQGMSARNGIFSAELARKGYTSVKDPLFSKYGYFSLYCPAYDAEILTRGLGKIFYSDSCFKIYSCCGAIIPTAECTLNMVHDHQIKIEDLDQVTINVTPAHLEQALGQPFKIGEFPQGNAVFNLRYVVASILLRKGLKPVHFTEQYVRDPVVFELSQQIQVTTTIPNEKHNIAADLRIKLKNGSEFETHIDGPRGSPLAEPITWQEIEQKFKENINFSNTIPKENGDNILDLISNLEVVEDMNELIRQLA
jgi:2-methylcitrate dehydratase PrpD